MLLTCHMTKMIMGPHAHCMFGILVYVYTCVQELLQCESLQRNV